MRIRSPDGIPGQAVEDRLSGATLGPRCESPSSTGRDVSVRGNDCLAILLRTDRHRTRALTLRKQWMRACQSFVSKTEIHRTEAESDRPPIVSPQHSSTSLFLRQLLENVPANMPAIPRKISMARPAGIRLHEYVQKNKRPEDFPGFLRPAGGKFHRDRADQRALRTINIDAKRLVRYYPARADSEKIESLLWSSTELTTS
jgi:hypothetical protein